MDPAIDRREDRRPIGIGIAPGTFDQRRQVDRKRQQRLDDFDRRLAAQRFGQLAQVVDRPLDLERKRRIDDVIDALRNQLHVVARALDRRLQAVLCVERITIPALVRGGEECRADEHLRGARALTAA